MSVRLEKEEAEALRAMARWARKARLGERLVYLKGSEQLAEYKAAKRAAQWICAAGLALPHQQGPRSLLVRTGRPWIGSLAVRRCVSCRRPAEPVRLFCGPNCRGGLMSSQLLVEDMLFIGLEGYERCS